MEKISIFVDVQNIYYTTKQCFGRHFDYNRFWENITSGREVVVAIAYAIDRGEKKQIEFQNILRSIGFKVKLKPFITRKDGSAKGDWDVGITIDILDYALISDTIVLVSGDGDFDILIKKVKYKYKCNCEVLGVPSLTANSLIKESSKFIPIDESFLI